MSNFLINLAGRCSLIAALAISVAPGSVSDVWAQTAANLPTGPAPNTRYTEAYARMVAREAYVWAWPMVNVYNRRLAAEKTPEVARITGGPVISPVNRLVVETNYAPVLVE